MSTHLGARIRIGLLIFIAILVQTTLASDMRVTHVAPDLMVLLAICAGMEGGTEAGAWVGFWSGLTADMFLTGTPVGLSALTYCLIGAATGALRAGFLQERRALVPLVAFLGTAVSVLLFVTIGDVLGQSQLLAGGRSWLDSRHRGRIGLGGRPVHPCQHHLPLGGSRLRGNRAARNGPRRRDRRTAPGQVIRSSE